MGSVKNGLEGPARHQYSPCSGPNVIEIKGRSIVTLLLNEAGLACAYLEFNNGPEIGLPPILRLLDRQYRPLVVGRLFLLRLLHRINIRCEHCHDSYRYEGGKKYSIALLD